jgi:mannose/fructose-specific phosphotransferase system component IIA
VNLPMLIRALTYREEASLDDLLEKSRAGAVEGVVRMEAGG